MLIHEPTGHLFVSTAGRIIRTDLDGRDPQTIVPRANHCFGMVIVRPEDVGG